MYGAPLKQKEAINFEDVFKRKKKLCRALRYYSSSLFSLPNLHPVPAANVG